MEHEDVKKYYDKKLRSIDQLDYETDRWFRNREKRAAYWMQKTFIETFLQKKQLKFSTYLEVGPGPGTWTLFFIQYCPDASFNLVEISEEMSKQLTSRFSRVKNVTAYTKDFMEFVSDQKFEFLFSSRAIEYIEDKEGLVRKMYKLLGSGGEGLIITKYPHYRRQNLFGKHVPEIHRRQVHPSMLVTLLKTAGFSNVKTYPVSFVFPTLRVGWLNMILFLMLSWLPLSAVVIFCESYAVSFQKK